MILGNLLCLNDLQLLQASAVYGLVLFTPCFLWAGWQDAKSHEIAEVTCLLIGAELILHALFFSGSWTALLLVVICLFFTFGPIEFDIFGQADFLMLVHFLTAFTFTATGVLTIVVMGVVWIVCLDVHLVRYRDEKGERWRPFKGQMIPAIPSYSVAVAISSVLRVLFIKQLFFAGF